MNLKDIEMHSEADFEEHLGKAKVPELTTIAEMHNLSIKDKGRKLKKKELKAKILNHFTEIHLEPF